MKKMFYVLGYLYFWLILLNSTQAQEKIRFVPYQGKYIVINDSLKTLSADNSQLIYPARDILSIDKNIPLEDWLRIYVQPNQAIILSENYERNTKSSNFWLTTESGNIKKAGYYNPLLSTISLLTISSPLEKQINWYFLYYLLMIVFITILLVRIKQGRLFKDVVDEENNWFLLVMTWLISALLTTPVIILTANSSPQYEKLGSPEASVVIIFGWLISYFILYIVNWFIFVLWIINYPKKNILYSKYAFFRLVGFIPITLILIMITAQSFYAAIPAILIAGLVWLIIFYHDRPKKESNKTEIAKKN